MHRLVYVSAASQPFSSADLLTLLSKARTNNQRLGVTGMLLFKDGDFLQLIEGESIAVQSVFATIRADRRHRNITVILEEEGGPRIFEDWSMRFRNLNDPQVHATPGYSHYLNTPSIAKTFEKHPSAALQLLLLFRPDY